MSVVEQKHIIMNYTVAPSLEDLQVMAKELLEVLPDELLEFCSELEIVIEDFPDEVVEQDEGLEDPYELLALYKSGKEIAPGIERKVANEDDVLTLYRRPVLDLWCEGGEDLAVVVRQVMIEEIGGQFDFSDSEVEEMAGRHFQGLL